MATDTVPTVDGVSMQSVSVLNTTGYTGAVCWRVLQHWSVVKLVVLHCVVGEQAPAHTQGCLGGRVGYLRVDYWSRWSCRRHICDEVIKYLQRQVQKRSQTLQTTCRNQPPSAECTALSQMSSLYIRPGTTLIESIMVLTSDRLASGMLNSRCVAKVRSISSLANSSILVWNKQKVKQQAVKIKI